MSTHELYVASDDEPGLPAAWISHIWSAMRRRYGTEFDRKWAPPEGDQDPAAYAEAMRRAWSRELARFQQNPKALSYGLENLPERPPNAIEFRNICSRRPESRPQPVLAHQLPASRRAEVIATLNAAKPGQRDISREWLQGLAKAVETGRIRPTIFQRNVLQEQLAVLERRQAADVGGSA